MRFAAVLFVVLVGVAACGGGQDGSSALACQAFPQWKSNLAAHLKTEDEARHDLQSIWNDKASIATDTKVKDAFQTLLADFTSGTESITDVNAVDRACASY